MWFKIEKQYVVLNVFVKPNAKKTALAAVTDDALQIFLHANPHEGKANQELISYLATLLRLPKSKIILVTGKQSRHKKVSVPYTDTVQQFLNNPSLTSLDC